MFTETTITILFNNTKNRKVKAHCKGGLCYHHTYVNGKRISNRYTISHHSGYGIMQGIESEQDAIALIDSFLAVLNFTGSADEVSTAARLPGTHSTLREIGARYWELVEDRFYGTEEDDVE
jgi:hypothetical protein